MNQKELNEIRRRFHLDRSSISRVYGCYVNGGGEIVSYIDTSLGVVTQSEAEMYLKILKKTLSGTLGKNLVDIVFSTKQVMEGEEHKLLSSLRSEGIKDAQVREQFYRKIIDCLEHEGAGYLILLAKDSYDVPYRAKDDTELEDSSDSVFTYLVCCICPVKDTNPELRYYSEDNEFHTGTGGPIVAAPELGFMFPTFDDRRANIYNALYYAHSPAVLHQEFIDSIFHTEPPMASTEQEETFRSVLTESLGQECSFDVIQSIHEQMRECIEDHKERKNPELPEISPEAMDAILLSSGVPTESRKTFREECSRQFGDGVVLNPNNLIDSRKFVVNTPDVKIQVSPDCSYTLEVRTIGGRPYILVPADGGVEVNGIPVVTGTPGDAEEG